MILDQEARAQFSLLIFSKSLQAGNDVRAVLTKEGYEVFVFNDQEMVIQRSIQAAPHVVVMFLDSLESEIDPFIEKILKANSEIQFLLVGEANRAPRMMAYRQYNVAGFVPLGENLHERVLWDADLICYQLYQGYMNEQLSEAIESKENEMTKLTGKIRKLESDSHAAPAFSVKDSLQAYALAHSKEEIIDTFIEQLQKISQFHKEKIHGVFFRFLPTVSSFVATHAVGIDIESLRGVGGKVAGNEAQHLASFLEAGNIPTGLVQLLQGPLHVKRPIARPLLVQRTVEGLFIFWSLDELKKSVKNLDEVFFVFALQYQIFHLSKRVDSLNVEDSLTGLYNREQYNRKLDEEISRARRLKNAVSIIKLTIDHLAEHEQAQGIQQRDSVLRTVSAIVRKSSRINDASCRTSENEIAIILPHCPRKGAAIRAERLRRMVESHDFASQGIRITLSLGISEYPTLSKSASDLDRSSSEAMKFISDRGGNKVCLYKPPEGFKPDYDVVPI